MPRPKRTRTSRCLEYNGGMLHEEELALRRALQASLNPSKTQSQPQKTKDNNVMKGVKNDVSPAKGDEHATSKGMGPSKWNSKSVEKKQSESTKRKSDDISSTVRSKKQKRLLVRVLPRPSGNAAAKKLVSEGGHKRKLILQKKKRNAKEKGQNNLLKKKRRKKLLDDDAEAYSNKKSSESTPVRVVHAQRKFAQTNPSSPRSLLLNQSQRQPLKTRAKTEDFLDFLCLRGTDRLPRSLEIFNNPCAPHSPLTDEEEVSKGTSPSKASGNEQNPKDAVDTGEDSSVRRSLNIPPSDEPRPVSNSSSGSSVSSPVSCRVQPHAVLPQFTNTKTNYGVLTHIPTPIAYPGRVYTPLTPPRSQGINIYGSPTTSSGLPPSLLHHPCVTSAGTDVHRFPSCSPDGKHGFHPVNPYWTSSFQGHASENVQANSRVNKSAETGNKPPKSTGKSPKTSPDKITNRPGPSKAANTTTSKLPNKPENKGEGKSANKRLDKNSKKGAFRNAGGNKGTTGNIEDASADGPVGQVSRGSLSVEEVPLFCPTEQEFKNPLHYIECIRPRAQAFGICAVVPPESWKPEYCLSDEIRFSTKLQSIHRLGNRLSAVEIELAAIRKHLEQQGISLGVMPQIAGCELDLPHMSKVVKELGGLQQIIDKRKWSKVADILKIPKTAVERTGKLEQIYCKYLLSFDLLSEQEKQALFDIVKKEENSPPGPVTRPGQDFVSKGRSMSLCHFQRTAKNNMEHHIRPNAGVKDIERTYWKTIEEGQRYVVVHTAELSDLTAFPTGKGAQFAKSKWNLNVLPKITGSAVRDLTGVEGISSPLMKVDMAFSTNLWQTPPHALYTMEYLHQGAEKIWYSVPSYSKETFLDAVAVQSSLKTGDLKENMISPSALVKAGVPVYRVTQDQGQFIIKFPGAYHSSIAAGFAVSEKVSFAPLSLLQHIKASFKLVAGQPDTQEWFSWEGLIVFSVTEELRRNSSEATLSLLLPELEEISSREYELRNKVLHGGVHKRTELNDQQDKESCNVKSRRCRVDTEMVRCHKCNRYCFLSSVLDQANNRRHCLEHALGKLKTVKDVPVDTVLVEHVDMSEVDELFKEARDKLEELRHKKPVKRKGTTRSAGDKKDKKA